ncbi:MAG: PAS domain S-box protein [Deltaproteobacteria bacterium]|nr:PAS domain S-box protein [Deltaproteobacteria bacterium]
MNSNLSQELNWRLRVFDSLPFPTLIMARNGTVVSVNQKLLEKYNISKPQVVGKSCREIFQSLFDDPDLPCNQEACPLDKTIDEGVGHSVLKQIQRRDGSMRWEDRGFSPILDDVGNVIYVVESIRDVTRTKALENIIHDIREFLNRVVQSSTSAIVVADRGGRILLMNQAAEELFGYDFQNAASISVTDLYPRGMAREIMKKLRNDDYGGRGKLPVTQVNILTARGESIPVEMTGAIIYEGDDTEAATMGIYNDIRERLAVKKKLRDAQFQLDQSEKMASLGRLAAGVAHEINNSLIGILMKEKMEVDHPFQSSLTCILEDAEPFQTH